MFLWKQSPRQQVWISSLITHTSYQTPFLHRGQMCLVLELWSEVHGQPMLRISSLLHGSHLEADSSSEPHCTSHTRTNIFESGEVDHVSDHEHFLYCSQSMQTRLSVSVYKVAHDRTTCTLLHYPAVALTCFYYWQGSWLPWGFAFLLLCLLCPLIHLYRCTELTTPQV